MPVPAASGSGPPGETEHLATAALVAIALIDTRIVIVVTWRRDELPFELVLLIAGCVNPGRNKGTRPHRGASLSVFILHILAKQSQL